MRRIKFRGRSINYVAANDSYWAYGLLVNDDPPEIECDDGDIYRVNDNTVGQYTGLEDADGREIYEGDIIEMNRGCYERDGIRTDFIFHAVVCWIKNGFMYKGPGIFGSTFDNVKVIGNVYDNPELLEAHA